MVFNIVHDMIILIVWEPEPRQFKAFAICWHPLLGASKYWRAAFRSMTSLFSLRKLHSAPTHTLGLALHLSHSTHSTFPWFWVKRPTGFATPRFSRTGQSGPWKVSDISFILLNIQQELLCQTHTSPLILRFFNQSLKKNLLTSLMICKLPYYYNQFPSFDPSQLLKSFMNTKQKTN